MAVLLPGESHGRRSLVGCSPWGRNKSDTTEVTQKQKYKPGFPGGLVVKTLPTKKTWVRSLGGEDPLENSLQGEIGFHRGFLFFLHKMRFLHRILCSPRQKGLPKHSFSCSPGLGHFLCLLTNLMYRLRELACPGFCRLYSWCHSIIFSVLLTHAPKSLQMMIAAMKLKDSYSLEGKL